MNYDIYLRHAAVHEGEWVGFALAWRGLAGIEGLPRHPHLHRRPWLLDPAYPNDPTLGDWGVRQWQLDITAIDLFVGLAYQPPEDNRDAAAMRADLIAYLDLPALELKDVDGTVYVAKVTGFQEQCIEPFDPGHPHGGWLARVELAETTI